MASNTVRLDAIRMTKYMPGARGKYRVIAIPKIKLESDGVTDSGPEFEFVLIGNIS